MATTKALDDLRERAGPLPQSVAVQLAPLGVDDVLSVYLLEDQISVVDDSRTKFRWMEEGGELGWAVVLYDHHGVCINAEHPERPGTILEIARRRHPFARPCSATDARV